MKSLIISILAIAFFLTTQQVEARHCRNTRVNINIGSPCRSPDLYIVRRAPPVIVAPAVYVAQPGYYYQPYGTPVYVQQPPVYVEQVYTAPRPLSFSGFSFFWNLR